MKSKSYLTLGEYISKNGNLSIMTKLSELIGKTIELPTGGPIHSSNRYWIPQWYVQDIDFNRGKVIIRKVIADLQGTTRHNDMYGNLEYIMGVFGLSISIAKPKEYELKIKENGRIKIGTRTIGASDVREYQATKETCTYMRMYD